MSKNFLNGSDAGIINKMAQPSTEKRGKARCPFCSDGKGNKRGNGCCYCDHTGMVAFGEGQLFPNKEEALNHDSEVSLYDRDLNRKEGRDLNYKPW